MNRFHRDTFAEYAPGTEKSYVEHQREQLVPGKIRTRHLQSIRASPLYQPARRWNGTATLQVCRLESSGLVDARRGSGDGNQQ
jgi:hypothetical protein